MSFAMYLKERISGFLGERYGYIMLWLFSSLLSEIVLFFALGMLWSNSLLELAFFLMSSLLCGFVVAYSCVVGYWLFIKEIIRDYHNWQREREIQGVRNE